MTTAHAVSPDITVEKERLLKHYFTLTSCQKPFVRLVVDWLKNPRKLFVIVSGGPGTGKSYVVKNTFDCIKTTELRMSFTGRSSMAIGGKTIHSTLKLNPAAVAELEKELSEETDLSECIERSSQVQSYFRCDVYPYVVIVDEVSMINGWLIYWMIRFFMDRTDLPLIFVCMGDPHQLNPIKSIYNLFSLTLSENKYEVVKIHLNESKRYTPEYDKLVKKLREFVDKKDETGMLAFICENFPVVEDVDCFMLMEADKAMAFTNSTVKYYNDFYIKKKVDGPEITLPKNLVLKPNCMVFVTKNNCSTAMNGTLLIFQHYDPTEYSVMCTDPKTGENVKVDMDFWSRGYPLDLGFAGTVHKYQGDTIDNAKIVINFDGNRNLNLIYTALSRVREMSQILAIKL